MVENNLNVMPWPSRSPDLNIIENVWHSLKQKVGKKNPSFLAKLEETIIDVWHNDL